MSEEMEMNTLLAIEILNNIFGRGKGFIDFEYQAWKFIKAELRKTLKNPPQKITKKEKSIQKNRNYFVCPNQKE
jgi:hypothetical protein